jgi:hypothetical protein
MVGKGEKTGRRKAIKAVRKIQAEREAGVPDAVDVQQYKLILKSLNAPVDWFRLSASANAFVQRSMTAILRIAKAETDEKLSEALAAPTDVGMIARAISNTAVAGTAIAELDPFASLIAKGAEVKQTLIQQAGGLLSASEVANARGLSPQAIYKQRKSRKLLSVPYAGEEKYPAIQFDREGRPLVGLSAVLEALNLAGPWGTLDFLLSPDAELDDLSPIEILRDHPDRLDELVRLARTQGEHGPG